MKIFLVVIISGLMVWPTVGLQAQAVQTTVVGQVELGAGVFPDVAWKDGKLWIITKPLDNRVLLYSANADLSGLRVEKTFILPDGDNAFPRLTVWNNILWAAYRDGVNIKLWRSDSDLEENLGAGGGNSPVALGYGYVAWQRQAANFPVVKRFLSGGTTSNVRMGASTGISRVIPGGSVRLVHEDRNVVPGYTSPAWAGNLTVAEEPDNGVVGFFDNDRGTLFKLWNGVTTLTPRAAYNGTDLYAVTTWSPQSGGDTIRVAVVHRPRNTDTPPPPPPGEELICDPLPIEDPDLLLQCNLMGFDNPVSGPIYGLGEDPANPIELPTTGVNGTGGAYNPSNNKILIISGDSSGGGAQVNGMIVEPSTYTVSSGPFRIDQGPGNGFARYPQTVYGPLGNNFLVAWEDTRSGSKQTYARFVAGDGALVSNEFQVMATNTNLNDLEYDSVNNRFVLVFENPGQETYIKTVDPTGAISQQLRVPKLVSTTYEGQSNIAINNNLNQYLLATRACTNLGEEVTEDCQIVVYQIDIATGTSVGQPVRMSDPNAGLNHISSPDIIYSQVSSAALIAWLEEDGQLGRTLYSGGSVSGITPILTPETFPFSDRFGAPRMSYNPWNNTVFVTSEDDLGGVMMVETTPTGVVLQQRQALSAPISFQGFWNKLAQALIPKALAAGTFNPTSVTTPTGALVMGTQGNTQLVFSVNSSLFAQGAGFAPATDVNSPAVPADTQTLPKLINQIYMWSLGIGALLALLMVVLGGYNYMTSAGNAEQAAKGTEMIWGAIIGLILLFSSYLILRTINPDLVQFNIESVNTLNNVNNTNEQQR